MAMTKEPMHTGEFIRSEANGERSREQGVLASGVLAAGAVIAHDGTNYVPLNLEAANGTEKPAGILYAAKDATQSPVQCVVLQRDCEVYGEALTWPEAATSEQKDAAIAELAKNGVIVR